MQPPLPVCTRRAGSPCRDVLVNVPGLWVCGQGLWLGCVEPPAHTSPPRSSSVRSVLTYPGTLALPPTGGLPRLRMGPRVPSTCPHMPSPPAPVCCPLLPPMPQWPILPHPGSPPCLWLTTGQVPGVLRAPGGDQGAAETEGLPTLSASRRPGLQTSVCCLFRGPGTFPPAPSQRGMAGAVVRGSPRSLEAA